MSSARERRILRNQKAARNVNVKKKKKKKKKRKEKVTGLENRIMYMEDEEEKGKPPKSVILRWGGRLKFPGVSE